MALVIEDLIFEAPAISAAVDDAAVSGVGDVPLEAEFEVLIFSFGSHAAGFEGAAGGDAVLDGPLAFLLIGVPLGEVAVLEEVNEGGFLGAGFDDVVAEGVAHEGVAFVVGGVAELDGVEASGGDLGEGDGEGFAVGGECCSGGGDVLEVDFWGAVILMVVVGVAGDL